MSLGVGGAAAQGLESGFNMGLRADAANEQRKQTAFENARQTQADADRTAELDRTHQRQDEEQGLQALNAGLEDQKYALGALQARYPGSTPPEAEARPIIDQITKIHGQRQQILDKRSRPIIEKAQQDARDFSSRVAIGAADPMSLSGPKFNEYILASTGIAPQQFLNGEVTQAITDAHAGLETKNYDLVFKAANVLLPEIKQGIGQHAPDGSTIVNKELVGFAPAPMGPPTAAGVPPAVVANPVKGLTAALNAATMGGDDSPAPASAGGEPAPAGAPDQPAALQPGSDPDKMLPVIKVTTRQPDGTMTSYHAPITEGRSADPNAPIAGPVSMKDMMDRLGQLGVLNTWMQKPEVKAKVSAGGSGPTSYEQAWGMVHGDVKALQEAHDPTTMKIKAIQKLATDKGITFEEASRQFAAKPEPKVTGVQGTLNAIKTSGLSDEDKAKAERVALKVEAAPKAGKAAAAGAGTKVPELGGVAAPDADEDAVNFWAQAVIAGNKDWQIGLSRSKSGSALIEKVKRRVPVMAKELGLEPQDIGSESARFAALSATQKDLTKRSAAVDLFSSKVEKDMKTFESLIDNASTGSPLLISKPINALRRQFSDPDLAQLDLAAKQVGNEYERLITGGTLSVAQLHSGASEDAKKLINGDMPPAQARAVMQVMRQEMKNARDAAHESEAAVNDKIRGLGRGHPTSAPVTPTGGGTGLNAAPAPAKLAPPKVGEVVRGYRFKGGDPAVQTSWEKAQ